MNWNWIKKLFGISETQNIMKQKKESKRTYGSLAASSNHKRDDYSADLMNPANPVSPLFMGGVMYSPGSSSSGSFDSGSGSSHSGGDSGSSSSCDSSSVDCGSSGF